MKTQVEMFQKVEGFPDLPYYIKQRLILMVINSSIYLNVFSPKHRLDWSRTDEPKSFHFSFSNMFVYSLFYSTNVLCLHYVQSISKMV